STASGWVEPDGGFTATSTPEPGCGRRSVTGPGTVTRHRRGPPATGYETRVEVSIVEESTASTAPAVTTKIWLPAGIEATSRNTVTRGPPPPSASAASRVSRSSHDSRGGRASRGGGRTGAAAAQSSPSSMSTSGTGGSPPADDRRLVRAHRTRRAAGTAAAHARRRADRVAPRPAAARRGAARCRRLPRRCRPGAPVGRKLARRAYPRVSGPRHGRPGADHHGLARRLRHGPVLGLRPAGHHAAAGGAVPGGAGPAHRAGPGRARP